MKRPKIVGRKTIEPDLTADKVVRALIDRLMSVEKQLAALKEQVDANFETFAESLPRTFQGGLVFRGVLPDGDFDETEGVDVVVPAAAKEPTRNTGN